MQTAIKNAITKAVTEMEEETRETRLSGNEFLDALFKKLFPEMPVKAPRVKKSAPTTDSEAPAPEKKKRTKKTESAPTTDSEAPATPKKTKAKKEKAPEVTVPVTPDQETKTIEVPAAPKKAGRPKKEKGPENLAKLTPTQTKKFKEQAGESADKKAFLAFVNAMTPEEYNSKKLEEHMAAFAKPAAPVAEEEVDRECIEVEFEGKTYYVSPEDKKVYAEGEDGVHVFKGYAGMAAFKDMIVPA
jgi:hypothetical protein